MQPDFWNDKRAAGVPLDIDLTAYKSVVDVFERSCKDFADRPAFSNLGVTLTYAELERYSAAFAGYLQNCTRPQARRPHCGADAQCPALPDRGIWCVARQG